jgi:hypothetical protein
MIVNLNANEVKKEEQKVDQNTRRSTRKKISGDFLFGNAFYRNEGGGRFQEESQAVNAENYWPWGVSVDDVNADGYDDVFFTGGMGFPFRYGISSLKLNEKGQKLVDAEFKLGLEPKKDRRAPMIYLDCAGAERNHPRCIYCKRSSLRGPDCEDKDEKGRLEVMRAASDRSSVLYDLDGDGDLDLVVSQFDGPAKIYLSDIAQRHPIHWLKVSLRGSQSNRDGLGAEVTVKLPDQSEILKVNEGKRGYLAQSLIPLYFGLGKNETADISVKWPSGKTQVLKDVGDRKILEVQEP